MKRKDFFANLSVSESEFKHLLASNTYACNADGRRFMAERVSVKYKHMLPYQTYWLLPLAERIGGCRPGETYDYPTPHGTMTAKVVDLYNLPSDMVNPMVLYFSGCLTAPLYDWEAIRPIIAYYGNMGWPNYEELLYGTPREEAVENIILADLFARASFSPELYDQAVLDDVRLYQKVIGTFSGITEEDFLSWCKTSPEKKFFN